MDLPSVGCVLSVGVHVLLWVQVEGPSGEDVTNVLIETVGFTGVSLTSINYERQLGALLWAPDTNSKVML